MTTVAAVAGVRRAVATQQAIELNKKHLDHLVAQRERNARYEASLRQEAFAQEEERKRRMREWFERYDTDASGVLECGELQKMLHALYPEEEVPSEELCNTLIGMCAPEGSRRGIRLEEVMATASRFHDYLKRKAELEGAFTTLDRDGSGYLEEPEIRGVMTDLVPGHALCDADLDFVYQALSLKRGAPVARDAMAALMPALAEWAKLAKSAAARHVVVDGKPPDDAKKINGKSRSCALM